MREKGRGSDPWQDEYFIDLGASSSAERNSGPVSYTHLEASRRKAAYRVSSLQDNKSGITGKFITETGKRKG